MCRNIYTYSEVDLATLKFGWDFPLEVDPRCRGLGVQSLNTDKV